MSVRSGYRAKIPLRCEMTHPVEALTLLLTIPMTYPDSEFTFEIRRTIDNESAPDSQGMQSIIEEMSDFYESRLTSSSEHLTVVSFVQRFMRVGSLSSTMNSIDQNSPALSVNVPRAMYTCHKCRSILFSSDEVESHSLREKSPLCSSIFLNEPTDWMQDVSGVEGKILCPRCASRVGSYCWAGLMCSCGDWVTPAIKFTKSKIDPKYSF